MTSEKTPLLSSGAAASVRPGHANGSGDASGLGRDMELAKVAYNAMDPDASRRAHTVTRGIPVANEKHGGAGSEYVRSIVFGGMDGILTSVGIVASIYGANLSAKVVVLLGFSNVFADAIAMGVGDFWSSKAENDYAVAERAREEWEYDNYRDGEVREMVDLYVEKGFSKADASRIITIMSKEKYKEFFLDHMMALELGLESPDPEDSPAKAGLAMFASFVAFGTLPILSYIFFAVFDNDGHKGTQFGVSVAATVAALFILGVLQAKFTEQSKIKSGLLMVLNGALTAGAAFAIGHGIEAAVNATGTVCA